MQTLQFEVLNEWYLFMLNSSVGHCGGPEMWVPAATDRYLCVYHGIFAKASSMTGVVVLERRSLHDSRGGKSLSLQQRFSQDVYFCSGSDSSVQSPGLVQHASVLL